VTQEREVCTFCWKNGADRFPRRRVATVEPSDYYDAPIDKVLHFIRGVGLIKGSSKGEAQ
jgi:hypothetical protein